MNIFCIRPKGFNIGNEAIYAGTKLFLDKAFGQVVNLISLPATARYESHADAGLTSRTVHNMNQYAHGVIVGGGNLYENGELDVDLTALEALEVPLFLLSLSRGRIYNRKGELVSRTDAMPANVVQALNRKASYSLARDHATQTALREIGCANVQVGGCPTVYLDSLTDRLPPVSPKDREGVFISVRNPALMNIPLPIQARIPQDLRSIVSLLRDQGYERIRLLCHDHRDIPFAATIPELDYIYTGDVHSYLALLKGARLCVSYRLHSVLPSLAFGTPVVSLSYDERASSLMSTLGFGEWDIDIVRSSDWLEAFRNRCRRLADLEEIRKTARPKWDQLYETTLSTFQRFASEVNS